MYYMYIRHLLKHFAVVFLAWTEELFIGLDTITNFFLRTTFYNP